MHIPSASHMAYTYNIFRPNDFTLMKEIYSITFLNRDSLTPLLFKKLAPYSYLNIRNIVLVYTK